MDFLGKACIVACFHLALSFQSVKAEVQECPASDANAMPLGNFSAPGLSLLQSQAALMKGTIEDELASDESVSSTRRRRRRRRRKTSHDNEKKTTTTTTTTEKEKSPSPSSGPGEAIKNLGEQLDEVTGEVKTISKKIDVLDDKVDKLAGSQPQPPPSPEPSGDGGGTPGKVPSSVPDRWVNAHNYYRCLHHAPPIHWDKDFARGAQKWADRGQMSHAQCYKIPPPEGPAGENLAGGSDVSLEKATYMWWNENPQDAPKCGGHCTAMLWKAAKKLGCGIGQGATGKLMVCRYGGGNPLPNFGPIREQMNYVGRLNNSRKDECEKQWPMNQTMAGGRCRWEDAGGGCRWEDAGGPSHGRGPPPGMDGMGGMHGGGMGGMRGGGMGGMRSGMRGGMGGMRGGMGGMRGGMGGMRGGMGGMRR